MERKNANYCRSDENAIDGEDLSWEKTVDLLDDLSGDSVIGGRCTKFTTNFNDSKVTIRKVGKAHLINERWNWEVKLQAPFEVKDQMDISDIDFDGLANAVKFTGGLHYIEQKGDLDDKSPFFRFGWDGSVAFESFDYITGTDINNMQSERQTHSSTRLYAAYYSPGKTDYMLGATLQYEQSYKAGEKKNICVNTGLNSSQCANVIVGAPTQSSKKFFVFDSRWSVSENYYNWGVKVTHDIENSFTKVDVPIYRARKDVEDAVGGVVISWDSLNREWRATLMVGTTFGFLDGSN